jgi:hypothetical protein
MHVLSVDPTQSLQPLSEGLDARNRYRISSSQIHQHADTPRAFALLCIRHGWPHYRPTSQRKKLPPPHTMCHQHK